MGEEEKNPNPIYVAADLVEEILLRLPLKAILKFKTVSKQWRSTLESKRFAERRRKSVQKNPIILAVGASRFQGDAEIDVVYLERADGTTTRPWLTCDGLVCIPLPGWVNVLNPSTGEFLRFPSGPSFLYGESSFDEWCSLISFPEYWVMGFGRDKVEGSYKVVRMSICSKIYEILDVQIGEWRKFRARPPCKVGWAAKSVCVNGSIYWLELVFGYKILALDLHTEEFRDLPVLPPPPKSTYRPTTMLVNLQDRLAMAYYTCISSHEGKLEIWSMDAPTEETWTRTYCISLSHRVMSTGYLCYPMAVSKQGNIVLYDNDKRLFKYYPETDYLSCLSRDICVITPFVENLVPLRSLQGVPNKISTSGDRYGLRYYLQPGFVSKICSTFVTRTPTILFTSTLLMSLVVFGYRYKYRS